MTEMYRDLVGQTTWNDIAVATSAHYAPGLGWLIIAVTGLTIFLVLRYRGRDRR